MKNYMNKSTDRELALQFWRDISDAEKKDLWQDFKRFNFSPSNNANELTGREIETIWKQEVNKKKFKDFLDTVSDEQICIDDDMDCLSPNFFKE